MKTTIIILTLCAFFLLGVIYVCSTEQNDLIRTQQKEIQFLLRKNNEMQMQVDGMLKTCDSLLHKMDSIKRTL